MYLQSIWVSPKITETEPWNFTVAGEHLVSVLALYVSNCKWHSTVQIQLVTSAHDKCTLCRVGLYGSYRDLLYRIVYCGYGACLMATNCSAREKITQHFELRACNNGDQKTYTFFNPPPL
jgi:hypothetical protein